MIDGTTSNKVALLMPHEYPENEHVKEETLRQFHTNGKFIKSLKTQHSDQYVA